MNEKQTKNEQKDKKTTPEK